MARATVRLTNPHGLHARPAAMFSMTASGFGCDVRVSKNGKTVNGKSVIKLISLDCRTGDEITITTNGDDEAAALEQLSVVVQQGLSDD
ncbi:MAG: phosphocarrier protein HPr [Frankiales bacterium]|jgi:phosphotransferase system HPr (HPr) family protein|nr:phosphocarrier protein HPr [Frankiales bacterium]